MPEQQPTVMVVENDESLREQLDTLVAKRGLRSLAVRGVDEALRCFRTNPPAAVVLDITDGADGLAALSDFKRIDRDVPVVVISGEGQPALLVQAMRSGAADFLCKPVQRGRLEASLERALVQRRLSAELAGMRSSLESAPPYRLLFSENSRLAGVSAIIDRVAETDAPVLVRGEAGTGKELVARVIHASSLRRGQPFVKASCGSLPPSQLEAELFGCERGGIAGAVQQKPGRLEFASHGTLFLDDVASLAPGLQLRLAQALRDAAFVRNGGGGRLPFDARVISSAAGQLEEAVTEGLFSRDLLLRLGVIVIELPPLRERGEDVRLLTDHFLTKYSVHYNKPRPRLSSETLRLFEEHRWPGNVDELESVVRRLVVAEGTDAQARREVQRATARAQGRPPAAATAAAPTRESADAGAGSIAAPLPSASLKEIARAAARAAECTAIASMLQRTRWNRKEAAEILGISYKALLYKIKENGLDKPTPAR